MLGGPSWGGEGGVLPCIFLGVLGLWLRHSDLCLGHHMAFSLCICVSLSKFPLLISTLVIRVGPTRVQCDLILTSYI